MRITGRQPAPLAIPLRALGLAVLLVLADCPLRAAPPEDQPAVTVATVKPQRTTVRRTLTLPGQVEASEQTKLYAGVAGFVQKVHVDIGDRVKAGQVLAELSVPELVEELKQKKALVTQAEAGLEQARRALPVAEAALQAARAQVQQAQAALKRARAQYEHAKAESQRVEELARQNVIDKQIPEEKRSQSAAAAAALEEVGAQVKTAEAAEKASAARREQAQAAVKVAEAGLEVARAEVARVAALLQHARVRAPFDGIVTQRNVDTGAYAQPRVGNNEPLLVVTQVDPVRVLIRVPEADVPLVDKGAPAVVRVGGLAGQEFKGQVTRTAWVLDAESRTLRAEVDLANPEGKLRPGMSASAAFVVERPRVWALPATAVVTEEGQAFCYRVENGKAVRTPLQVGLRGDQRVEVLKKQTKPAKPGEKGTWEDFTGDEEIIRGNLGSLRDGRPVRVDAGKP
jgi:RND family efflux transporter MFP subunit